MERVGVRLVARALVALCVTACVLCGAPAAHAAGARTIAQAPGVHLNTAVHGRMFDGAFFSGYSVAYWLASLRKGDHITLQTTSSAGDTPPCQMLFMPGTDDINVGSSAPILDPASQTRHGPRDFQRFVPVTQSGTYVLAMTNLDSFLSGPHQCLDASPGRPFTFAMTVAHGGGGAGSEQGTGKGGQAGDRAGTRVVERGQSLWVIARSLAGAAASNSRVVSVVERLWRLNAARIGSGDPDLIFPGQTLRLR